MTITLHMPVIPEQPPASEANARSIREIFLQIHDEKLEKSIFGKTEAMHRIKDDNLRIVTNKLKFSMIDPDTKSRLLSQVWNMARMAVIRGESEHAALDNKIMVQFLELLAIKEVQEMSEDGPLERDETDENIEENIRADEEIARRTRDTETETDRDLMNSADLEAAYSTVRESGSVVDIEV